MAVPTPFHPRTSALCRSLLWKEWAGHHAVVSYDAQHEHEYAALRHTAGLLDVTPLFKYRVSGPDACRLIDRVITRDARRIEVGQVVYTHWCDAEGKVIDDGTVARLHEDVYRWTAAEPNLRWLTMNTAGLQVTVEDVSETTAALALQGPTSREVLRACAADDLSGLRYFRLAATAIAGVPVEVSRTGYTGDLGYEIWMDAGGALPVWDALMEAGRPFELRPVGLSALDVTRIEAGLILLGVDYVSARAALVPSQKYTPYEIGLGRLVHLDKPPFVGQPALRAEVAERRGRRLVGLEVDWDELEELYDEAGMPPQIPSAASRISLPVYQGERQVGKATSNTWSPVLKKMIALATLSASVAERGGDLRMEWTVDHRRRRVGVRIVNLPFFDPPRKRANVA